MIPDASCWGSGSRTTAVSGAGVNGRLISIGMNSFDDTTDRRASAFFHAKIRFAFMPCRRAISATDASPRLASSTILSFSASGQVRLRRWRCDCNDGTGGSSDNVLRSILSTSGDSVRYGNKRTSTTLASGTLAVTGPGMLGGRRLTLTQKPASPKSVEALWKQEGA
jgi:hypothetical protein